MSRWRRTASGRENSTLTRSSLSTLLSSTVLLSNSVMFSMETNLNP